MGDNLYTNKWKKHSVKFKAFLESDKTVETFQLSKHELENPGNRSKSGYTFNLVLKNGVTVNNIGGSAVARDLRDYLVDSPFFKKLLKSKVLTVKLGIGYQLTLHKEIITK